MFDNRVNVFVVLMAVVIAVTLSACTDDSDPVPLEEFSCKVEGVSWNAMQSFTAEINNGVVIVNGVSNNNDTLILLIQDHEPGVHPVKNTQNIIVYKSQDETYLPLNSAEANLIVVEHDEVAKWIWGGFFYTGINVTGERVEITDGVFRVFYD